MKYGYILLVTLSLCGATTSAQQSQKAKIKADAEKIAVAAIQRDFETVLKYTLPKLIELMGGKDNAIVKMKEQGDRMDIRGDILKDAIIGEPGDVSNYNKELYALVPQKIILQSKGISYYTTSTLLATSPDEGTTWYFIGVSGMSEDQLKTLFPGFYQKLIVPKGTGPLLLTQ